MKHSQDVGITVRLGLREGRLAIGLVVGLNRGLKIERLERGGPC
jgi:hypothetical protein